jgi:hypothetical protein
VLIAALDVATIYTLLRDGRGDPMAAFVGFPILAAGFAFFGRTALRGQRSGLAVGGLLALLFGASAFSIVAAPGESDPLYPVFAVTLGALYVASGLVLLFELRPRRQP